ncbi:MAG TPA: IS1634 family transposase [Gemmatimonadaceae bacterium]|nr:IS1634 family transposase [Gemmatimonadaceae bacterium]
MYLRSNRRFKDGKWHCYWNIVESRRCADGRIVQHQVLYLGEINASQHEAWCRVIEAFDEDAQRRTQLALFPADCRIPEHAKDYGVSVRLDAMQLHRPRQWGACWLACQLYEQLGLDRFWEARLPDSREGTCWRQILKTLVCYRLIDPGSEWRLHRLWFESSAMADLLGADYSLVEKNALYRCHDKLLPFKTELFTHLTERWRDLFGARFEVLLYDLTSTYFESAPPDDENDQRRYGYSRDKRSDCVQVVIALIVTPDGFPLAYEVLPGNTTDKTTLREFLRKIETQYGKAERIWVMDRGIPTEKVLKEMRASDPPVYYLVGTPKGRLSKLERALLPLPWADVRPGVHVKLLPQDEELYVFAQSHDRILKERAMRMRQLKRLVKRLKELQTMQLKRTQLLIKLGEAKGRYRAAWRLIDLTIPDAAPSGATPSGATPDSLACRDASESQPRRNFAFCVNRKKLRQVRRREGRYLLRTNLCGRNPAELWQFYIQLTEIEAAFKNLKDDLELRPIYHQLEHRIDAHIFIAFMAYCLHVTLRARLKPLAPGLTPRAVLDKFAAIQMLDVHFPTTDGRTLVLTRYTEPAADQKILLEKLNLVLPPQSPPKITAAGQLLTQ